MATSTAPRKAYTDEHGIERASKQQTGGFEAKVEKKSPAAGHLLRMNDRFSAEGGNQFAAGITYFSVLSLFPLLMLLFAGLGFFLNARPDLIQDIQDQITKSLDGDLGDMMNDLVDAAIDQRGTVAGIGLLTTLWSGLSWMNNLRVGVSAMWKVDPNKGGNFVTKKLWDLLGLVVLIVLFIVAFGVTAVGVSSWTSTAMEHLGIGDFPGARFLVWLVGFLVSFLVMLWVNLYMPRTKVPVKSGLLGALLGAVIFAVLQQFAGLVISSATGNPAGAIFGPIITLMVVLYLIWRVVLYVAAWTATTEESLALAPAEVPEPAVINVRSGALRTNEESHTAGKALGVGAALGAIGVGVASLLSRD